MDTAHRLEFFLDADGEAWACFVWGHVPTGTITRERILEAAAYHASLGEEDLEGLDLDPTAVRHFWLRKGAANGDFDEVWLRCLAEDDGAVPVTGVQFQ